MPYLFLIQVLQQLDYKISHEEFDIFVNLATSQDDLNRIVTYIKNWKELNNEEKEELTNIIKKIPMHDPPDEQPGLFGDDELNTKDDGQKRYIRIHQDSSYQRAFYCFPHYLEDEDNFISCISKKEIDTLISEKIRDLKISIFRNKADWFAYYGNPDQKPSWFTYLSLAVEHADSKQEAEKIIQESGQKLDEQDAEEIKRKQLEKGIEDFYVNNLYQIEEGLKLVDSGSKEGRQYSTPIGLIDLLCRDKNGAYVVIEIKADEAKDSVFGQILRYIGWIHRNLEGAHNNVRGIIIASNFPDKARYSRIGLELLSKNYENFIRFKKHGFNLQDT